MNRNLSNKECMFLEKLLEKREDKLREGTNNHFKEIEKAQIEHIKDKLELKQMEE